MGKNRYPYVATETIEVPPGSGVVAFVEGQEVPAESVESLGVEDKVRSISRRGPVAPSAASTPSS